MAVVVVVGRVVVVAVGAVVVGRWRRGGGLGNFMLATKEAERRRDGGWRWCSIPPSEEVPTEKGVKEGVEGIVEGLVEMLEVEGLEVEGLDLEGIEVEILEGLVVEGDVIWGVEG